MNLILLLAMLQGISVDINTAPEFRVVTESALVQPEKSKYYERTKARILAMKTPYEFKYKAKKYYITSNFYWSYRSFYFNDVLIPLNREEEWELRDLLIEKNKELEEEQRRKKLEKL